MSDRERKINESQTGNHRFLRTSKMSKRIGRVVMESSINQSIQTCLQVSQYVVSNLSAFQYSTPHPAREKNKTKNKHPHLSTLKKRDPSQCSKKKLASSSSLTTDNCNKQTLTNKLPPSPGTNPNENPHEKPTSKRLPWHVDHLVLGQARV